MPWRKPLPKPITLIDGRVLETLLDARDVLSEADADKSPSALRALELLLEASESGDPVAIQVAAITSQSCSANGNCSPSGPTCTNDLPAPCTVVPLLPGRSAHKRPEAARAASGPYAAARLLSCRGTRCRTATTTGVRPTS
jgi:hypothetical protein